MIDPGSVAEGAVAGIAAHHATKDSTIEIILQEMLTVLHDIHQLIHSSAAVDGDIEKFVNLYVQNVGSDFTPTSNNRRHFYVFSPTILPIVCRGTALGAFTLTIPQAVWTQLDLPSDAIYNLDPSYPQATAILWCKWTNENINA
jgi:hypothetical protein